jgi:23S rRNA (cytidine2498-2'-O)-methyltransferase
MKPHFLFTVCQRGAEQALKKELARQWPDFRFAYSRPGFLTFKLPEDIELADDFELRSVFARTHGFSLGKVAGDTAEALARSAWELVHDMAIDHLHVWQRDADLPGERGFEPGLTPLAEEIGAIIAGQMPPEPARPSPLPVNRVARSGDRVLDCVLVEPNEWWVGYHRAATMPSRWPGGTPKVEMPPDAVSRAYLKMEEALLWSRLPVAAGDRCVEIGSAPGGSCQALLDCDLLVAGIDPADMDEALTSDPNFTHIKARGAALKRIEFRGVKWLMADSNVAPHRTLDTVEDIVTNREVHIRGLLLTLKLPDWSLAESIPEYLERVRSWGYRYVNARQLAFNRHEFCIAALRSREQRRPPPRQRRRPRLP